MTRVEKLRAEHPDLFVLDLERAGELEAYLRERGWLEAGERVARLSRAGEGNMNLVARVETGARSFIVKQARPWVEKYDSIDAPWDRARVEGAFYRAVSSDPELASRMPALLAADESARVLVFEDLGEARDHTWMYTRRPLEEAPLDELTDWLVRLHGLPVPADPDGLLANREMRKLDHEHIFALPLRAGNGLDLEGFCPGLAIAAAPLFANERYLRRIAALGRIYLGGTGASLLHGDYYPGSWLETSAGPRIIDPEFCFVGAPEIDLGVMIAHLMLSEQPRASVERVLDRYGAARDLDEPLALGFAGAEIMRRIIGVAQLPLVAGVSTRAALLSRSVRLVLDGGREALR